MNLVLHFVQPIATFLAQVLVNSLAFSVILFCWAFSVILLQRRWSAATRHRIWLLMFVSLALTPVLSILKLTFPAAEQVHYYNELSAGPALSGSVAEPVSGAVPLKRSYLAGAPEAPAAPDRHIILDWTGAVDWTVVISAIWAAFTLGCLLRLIAAIHSLWRLHTSARPIKSPHPVRGHTRRKFQLAESDCISAPMAIGLWAPKILVPPGLRDRLSEDEFIQVVLHEVGHIERRDDWSNFLVQILIAFNPLNPFLWLVSRSLSLAREMACDDWVVAGGVGSKDYAGLLARLAAKRPWAPVLASGVVRAGNQVFRRVERILDSGCNRKLRPSSFVCFQMLVGLSGLAAMALFLVPAFAFPQARASEPVEQATPDESSGQDRRPDAAAAAADPELVAVLKEAAKGDKDPNVRREAVRSLFRLGSDDAVTALVELLDRDTDTETQLFILGNLSRRQCALAQVRAKLSQLAENGQPEVRIVALEQLGRTNDPNAVDQLIAIYKASDRAELKRACLRSLARLATKPAREFLMETAKSDRDPSVRSEALRMLVAGVRHPARILVRGSRVQLDREDSPLDEDLDSELPERLDPGLRDKLDDLDVRMGGLFLKTRKLHDRIYLERPGMSPGPELAPAPPAGEQQPGQSNPTPSPGKE